MSEFLSLRISTLDDARTAFKTYYDTVRATPRFKLPTHARNHLYDMMPATLNETDKEIISAYFRPTPQQTDDMFYIDYYWLPLLSDDEKLFMKLKIGLELAEKKIWQYFPYSRTSYNNWVKRCLQKFVDFENNKNIKNQRTNRYKLK